jgi:hypothetical protein
VRQYCYVMVMSDGTSCWTRVLANSAEPTERRDWGEDNLSLLLQAGWRPVRETPMSGSERGYVFSLVVLEKD